MDAIIAPPAAAGDAAPQSSEALLDSIFPESTPTETPAEGAGAEGEAEETPLEAAAEAPDEFDPERLFDEDEADPEKVDQDGRNAYKMSEGRMAAFTAAKHFHDAVRDFAPSVEAAKEHYQRASDFSTMESDFRNPGEMVDDGQGNQVPSARSFLDYWHGVSPEGMGSVAQMLPQYLAETGNVQALQSVESAVIGANINRLYSRAAQSGDPEDLARAQNADFALTGKFRESVQRQQANPQQNQLQNQQRSLEQRMNQIVQREWGAFNQASVEGPKEAALNSQLDTIFNKPEVKGAFSEPVLQALRNQTITDVQQRLGRDPEWIRNHQIALRNVQSEYQQAVRNNQATQNLTPRAKAIVDDYSARIRREIFAAAKSRLQGATRTAVDANRSTHQRLAASAGKTAPSGGGKPVQRSIASIPPDLKGADLIEWSLNN